MDQYFEGLPVAITVTDKENRIVDMNQRSADVNNHSHHGMRLTGVMVDLWS